MFIFFLITAILLVTGAALDGYSTWWFEHHVPDAYEQNPLFGSRPSTLRIFGEGAAIIGAELALAYRLTVAHPVWGVVVCALMIGQAALHVYEYRKNMKLT